MRAMWETAKMSYCCSGRLFMLHWNMMYLQKEYTIHLAVVSHAPTTPSGVSNIVKTKSSPPNDLYANSMVCFSYKHQWLIVLFTRGTGPATLSEWVTLRAVWKGLRVTSRTCRACDLEPTELRLPPLVTDGAIQTTALAPSVCYDREQQLNHHNILAGVNMRMCD